MTWQPYLDALPCRLHRLDRRRLLRPPCSVFAASRIHVLALLLLFFSAISKTRGQTGASANSRRHTAGFGTHSRLSGAGSQAGVRVRGHAAVMAASHGTTWLLPDSADGMSCTLRCLGQ